MISSFKANLDCRHFIGEKPCKFKRLCENCNKYDPLGQRILIIKLAALGDVLRTTSLLPALANKYPKSHVTWVTMDQAIPLLRHNPMIDRVMELDWETTLVVTAEEFDLVICLDKDPRATALAKHVKAGKKNGFGMSRWGNTEPMDANCEYAFRLGIDDQLKFHENQLTYQEIIHEICGIEEIVQGYVFEPTKEANGFGESLLDKLGLKEKKVVGLNTGAGTAFANKAWVPDGFVELANWLKEKRGLEPLLLGGPGEKKLNREIAKKCRVQVSDTQGKHDLMEFAGVIGKLDLLITSDSLAMHLGLAQKVPSVVIFGSTCPNEIMLTGKGELLSAGLDCQPCYKKECKIKNNCMESLELEEVKKSVDRVWGGVG